MGVKKKKCVVLVYNSFLDPLFQNLVYQYMRTLISNRGWSFYLITFEQPDYHMTKAQMSAYLKELYDSGIEWHPKKHHTGRALLLKKAYDFVSIFLLLFKLKLLTVSTIWSFANVAASMGWVYGKIFNFKTIIFSYEPHAQFMVELGLWRKESWNYRILNFLERKAGQDADYVLTGTKFMASELLTKKKKGKVFRAPTAVDEKDFYFRSQAYHEVRIRNNFPKNAKIVLYVGKFGGLYYTKEIILLFKILSDSIPQVRFIVISSNAWSDIVEYCNQVNFPVNRIHYLTKVSAEDIKVYMSGADLGVSAVPPTPSQRYRSPTKVAEYLLCGLPFITCKGISEDDIVVNENNVGVVVEAFTEASIRAAISAINAIMYTDKLEMVKRCRAAGLEYRAKSNIDKLFKNIFDEISG